MTRPLDAALAAEIVKPGFSPAIFVQIDFAGGATPSLYVWNGYGSITWNSQTWTGLGYFGGISSIPESSVIRADGIELTLSGIPQALLDEAMLYARLGKRIKVWVGALDASGAPIAPWLAWVGRTDEITVEEGGDTSTIKLKGENDLLRLQIPNLNRFTDLFQQSVYPGDLGFAYIVSLQNWTGMWGPGAQLRQAGEDVFLRLNRRRGRYI